jgi:hypothetical protein
MRSRSASFLRGGTWSIGQVLFGSTAAISVALLGVSHARW